MLIPDLKICSEMYLVDNNIFDNYHKFKELSDWIIIDNYCATRIIKNGKIENVSDRVAFIEKTPRTIRKNRNLDIHKLSKIKGL